MPRHARIVVPGVPHHVTQRGNRRQQTFYGEGDYARYVELVAKGCEAARVEVVAWCLMPNHVHLVLVPTCPGGLRKALAEAHRNYTWTVNRRNCWTGHLWQNRFFSNPLDSEHLLAAVRYIELNPVRARLVQTPEQWRWSSAAGHISRRGDKLVHASASAGCPVRRALHEIADWRAFLSLGLSEDLAQRLRLHQRSGLPLGTAQFAADVEAETAVCVRRRGRGRPPKKQRQGLADQPRLSEART